jgi:hypothetical protein
MRIHPGPVRLALLIAAVAIAAAVPQPAAPQQPPDSAVAQTAAVHVDSVEINLAAQPRFTFAVNAPVVLRFEAVSFNGQQLLHIWAYTRTGQTPASIRRAAHYAPNPTTHTAKTSEAIQLQALLTARSTVASASSSLSSGLRASAAIGTLITSGRLYRSRALKIS